MNSFLSIFAPALNRAAKRLPTRLLLLALGSLIGMGAIPFSLRSEQPQPTEPPPIDHSFNGLEIGANLKDFPDLEKKYNLPQTVVYKHKNDPLDYEGVPLEGVSYEFLHGKLLDVFLSVQGKKFVSQAKDKLFLKYGQPSFVSEDGTVTLWHDEKYQCEFRDFDAFTAYITFAELGLTQHQINAIDDQKQEKLRYNLIHDPREKFQNPDP